MIAVIICYRDGRSETVWLAPLIAALLVQAPPADVSSLRVIGGCDDWLRSHVPFTPYAHRPDTQAGKEQAPCN